MTRILDPWRALVRLWLFGSLVWILFWAWRDASGCFRAGNGRLWCPNAAGDAMMPTSYGHVALNMLGPPIALLALGMAYLWFARGAQDQRGP
jgi:hypothetical protein